MESQPPQPRVVDPEGFPALQRFALYETATNLFIVGSDKARTQFRILIIDRSQVYSLQLVEDPHVYPRACIVPRLRQLLERAGGPLESHFAFHALVGFLPLPKLHLVLVSKKHKLGSVANRWIYGITDWTLFPLAHKSYAGRGGEAAAAGGSAGPRRGESSRYRELVTSHIDLSKDFYFSFFYDVTHSLQHNCAAGAGGSNSYAPAASPAAHQPPPPLPTAHAVDDEKQQSGNSGGLTKSVSTPLFPSRQPPSWSPSASALSESIFSSGSAASEASTVTAAPSPASPSPSPSPAVGSPLPKSNSSSPFVSSNPWADLDSSFAAAANAPPAVAVTVNKLDSSAPFSSAASLSPASRDLAASFPVPSPSASSPSQRSAPFLPALPPRSHLYNDQWLWNFYLTSGFLRELPHASYWLVPLVHGFFQQQLLRCGNADLLVTLLARRSRHFAGPRYIRRGINSVGHVANEVETEQLIECLDNRSAWFSTGASYSSVVMLRGSIPLFWSQENLLSMKPNIVVQAEQDGLIPTRLHFDRLLLRYGPRIDILSLIRKEERAPQETRLGLAYTAAIAWLQERWKEETGAELQYQTYDFISMRAAKANVLRDVRRLVSPAVELHGVFSFVTVIEREDERDRGGREVSSASDLLLRERRTVRETRQTGVVRVNCVDCLDRTNVAQFCVAKAAMKLQLQQLGLLGRGQADSKVWPELLQVMQSMFTLHGDRIAQQYAGSGAMHRDALYDREKEEDESKDVSDLLSGGVGQATRDRLTQEAVQDAAAVGGSGGEGGRAGGGRGVKAGAGMAHNAISFAKRYYSNNVTDVEKQQAINVFLGHYLPAPAGRRGQQVWDIDAAEPIAEFDQQRGGRANDFFFLPYNPNVLADLQLGKKRRGAVLASPGSTAAVDAQHEALRRRFAQFFDEKYNPSKLTSLEKELAKPFVRPVYVGQQPPLLLADPATQRLMPVAMPPTLAAAAVRNGAPAAYAGGDSAEASPVSVSASSSAASVPPLRLAQDDAESQSPPPPLSPASERSAAELSRSPLPALAQYDTPPHSPSPQSLRRHHSMDLPSPAHAHSSAPPSPAPPQALSPSAAADPFAFNLSAGVINAPHPGHKTGLAQANAVANKVGAATKSLFSKMDRGLKTAFAAHRAAADRPLLHRVRSAGNVHGDAMEQTAGGETARAGNAALAMPVAQLAMSRSQDFHFLDAQAATAAAATQPSQSFSASGPLSPTSNISPRKSSRLPPPHGNPSSSSASSRSTQAAAAKEASSGLTRLVDLVAEVKELPAYHSHDSPRHQQAANAQRMPQQQQQQQDSGEQAADEAEQPQAASASSVSSSHLSSYDDRFITPRNDDEIFAAYLNTARLYAPVDINIPWTETFRAQMSTDDAGAALQPLQHPATDSLQQQQQQQHPASPALLSRPSAASTSVLPVSSVAAQLRSEASGEVNLVTSTLPVTGASSAAVNAELEKATGSDPLAASTEVPGSSDEAAVAKLAGELH